MLRNRKNIRLKGYDYSSEGLYFITICTKDRKKYFGEIIKNQINLSPVGKITDQYIKEISGHFPFVKIHEYVVMPDHVHMILQIMKNNVRSGHGLSLQQNNTLDVGPPHEVASQSISNSKQNNNSNNTSKSYKNKFGPQKKDSLSVIIGQFKSSVKRWCNKNNYSNFEWFPRFNDRIIRNENEYREIENYIFNNPKK